jgi:superfamily II DNA/RNA helicase
MESILLFFSLKKINSFADYGAFPEWLIESCSKQGFNSPTEVQARALPVIPTLFRH